jgi:DNA-binding MarR family transcriptional regulator
MVLVMTATISVPEEACAGAKAGLTQHAGFLLAQLGRAMTRQYRCALSPIGLKPRETQALLRLRDEGPMSQQALGTALDTDASNLVGLLNDLEAESLISRRRDPEDRRRHVVEVSMRGAKLLNEVERAAAEVEDQFFASLDDDERLQLQGLLVRVARSAAAGCRRIAPVKLQTRSSRSAPSIPPTPITVPIAQAATISPVGVESS